MSTEPKGPKLHTWAAWAAVGCTIALAGCRSAREKASFVNPDGTRSPAIALEVAQTEGEQKLGLMYRKELPERSGMLFIFDREEARSFWMKNTYLELDMIFLNAEKRVVCVTRRAAPLTEEPRRCAKPAKYVLEVNGGLAERWGVVEGSSAAFGG